jgi:DnaJ-class molecular chaperone
MTFNNNYYDILGIPSDATPSEIKDKYIFNANILHPDHTIGMSEKTRKQAEEKLKLVNVAYETLSNPEKRRQYDIKIGISNQNRTPSQSSKTNESPDKANERRPDDFKKESNQDISRQNNPNIPPKPEVYPNSFKLVDALPFKKQKVKFFVKNTGGHYTTISVSSPKDCITGIETFPLNKPSKLPMRVDVDVMGTKWGVKYTAEVKVRLDDSETRVKIDLQTQKKH